MNLRQQYYLFWVTVLTGALLITLGVLFYKKQFGLKRYTDKTAGFAISYPPDWAYASRQHGALVVFYSPAESDYDQFTENVTVVLHDISRNPMDIRQYSFTAIQQMETLFGQELDVLESEETNVGGRRGHRFVFVGRGESAVKMLMVWTMKGNEVYQITYTALGETYDFYVDTAQRMIDSFRLL